MGREFDTSVTRYMASQAAQIDAADIEDAVRLITRKGFGTQPNSKLLILAKPDEGELIQAWRAGEPSRPSGPDASFDFIPANDAPPFITQTGELVGQQVPGEIWVSKSKAATAKGCLYKAISFHLDVSPLWRRVALAVGKMLWASASTQISHTKDFATYPGEGQYPIIGSYGQRSFGVGVRQRGTAVAIKVVNSSSYTAPSATQIPV